MVQQKVSNYNNLDLLFRMYVHACNEFLENILFGIRIHDNTHFYIRSVLISNFLMDPCIASIK